MCASGAVNTLCFVWKFSRTMFHSLIQAYFPVDSTHSSTSGLGGVRGRMVGQGGESFHKTTSNMHYVISTRRVRITSSYKLATAGKERKLLPKALLEEQLGHPCVLLSITRTWIGAESIF